MPTNDTLRGMNGYADFENILLGRNPGTHISYAMGFGLLELQPEITDMVGIPQSPTHHPEGSVFLHTMMVVDEAAKLRENMPNGIGYCTDENMALMLGTLCHDFGKPEKTGVTDEGRIHSKGHEAAGISPTRNFLRRIGAPNNVMEMTEVLVEFHRVPVTFLREGAKAKAYRRLGRKLDDKGVTPELLARVATADQFGRTTEKALAKDDSDIREFLARMEAAMRKDDPQPKPEGIVTGRMLIDEGYKAGPEMGRIIARALAIQQDSGIVDSDILIGKATGQID